MNKLHILALTGLMLCGVNNISAMGQEQREVLYTLHMLEQNFGDVPMIFQNIDMFIGIEEMNIKMNELKLKTVNKELKTALLKNAALLGGILLAQNFSLMGLNAIRNHYSVSESMFDVVNTVRMIVIDGFILNDLLGLVTMGKVFAALNVYDVWKKRSELMQVLALDTEISVNCRKLKLRKIFS